MPLSSADKTQVVRRSASHPSGTGSATLLSAVTSPRNAEREMLTEESLDLMDQDDESNDSEEDGLRQLLLLQQTRWMLCSAGWEGGWSSTASWVHILAHCSTLLSRSGISSCWTTVVRQPSVPPTTVRPYPSAVPRALKTYLLGWLRLQYPVTFVCSVCCTNVLTYLHVFTYLPVTDAEVTSFTDLPDILNTISQQQNAIFCHSHC